MSTLLPFLYQTRTIQLASRGPLPVLRSFHAAAVRCRRQESNIPFEWDDNSPHKGEEGVGEDDTGPATLRNSTITPTEERAFRKIFADIAKRSRRAQDHQQASELLNKYPTALRESARAALGLPQQEAGSTGDAVEQEVEEVTPPEILQRWEAQKTLRDEAAERVEQLFKECKTDDEIGSVMEREVFSMVKKLGIEEGKAATRFALGEPEDTPAQETHDEATENASSVPKLDMESHGPLYSLHLLQGLRALDQDFSRPSSLALKVLPRIRELGMASYVLGASTPFYNELAAITWRRHGDVRGVMGLFQEMLFAGLTPDLQTLKLVHEIEERLDAMSDGKEGPFAKLLSTMPEYDFDVRAQLGILANKLEPAVRKH